MATKLPVLKNVKKFTVKRSNWYRGQSGNSYLLNNKGKMCCVGFLALEAGATGIDRFKPGLNISCGVK